METGVPPTHRYPTGFSQEKPSVDDKAKDTVFAPCKRKRNVEERHKCVIHLPKKEPRVDDKAKDKVFAPSKRKRNKEKRHVRVIDLPREIIFNILLFIPAKRLHDVMRYVCKQWYDIVNDPFFVRAHSQMPTTTTSASYLIQFRFQHELQKVYCADRYRVNKSVKLTKIELPFLGMTIQCSCNGLVLLSDYWDYLDKRKFYLMNPLTKIIISLPSVVGPVDRPYTTSLYSFAVNSSGQYKMVRFSVCDDTSSCDLSVFTIGVDKAWRHIDLQHHQDKNATYSLKSCEPTGLLIIAGILYWCSNTSRFLAMDIDTETLYLINWPKSVPISFCHMFRKYDRYFISMANALGLMAEVDSERAIWKLLKLTDIKSSEWTEIGMIDIGAMVSKVSNGKWTNYEDMPMKPVSLIHGELHFYCHVSMKYCRFIRYNLANESFVSSVFYTYYPLASGFHHVPTLVSPKNFWP